MIGIIAEMVGFMVAGHMAKRTAVQMGGQLAGVGIKVTGNKAAARMARVMSRGQAAGQNRGRAVYEYVRKQGHFPRTMTYGQARDTARGTTRDVLRSAMAYRGWKSAETLMWAVPMLGLGGELLSGVGDMAARAPLPSEQALQTQQFMLPRAAHTMRQRQLQAIHSSQMTTRAAIGNEAEFLHR